MSLASTLQRGRRMAESLMLDTFTAYAPSGTTTDADGYQVPGFASQGTTRGKVQGSSSQRGDTSTRMVNIGGTDRPVVEGGLHLPLASLRPAVGDRGVGWEYVCTAVGPASDPSLVGRRWLVVDAPAKSYATARRLDVVEV